MKGTLNTDAREPHELSPTEALERLGTHLHHGLSSREAQNRLVRFGPNALPTGTKRTAFGRLLLQFRDVQVYLLLTAAAVSLLVWTVEHASGFPYEAIAILAIVLLNACFGFLQEAKADHALAALRSMTPAEASVLRDGQVQRIPAERMVPGDLIVVREGDRIAADARLVEVTAFHTQESALTGESTPVLKTIEPMPRETASADRRNMILSGTIAISGHARAVVTATGTHTEFGGIAQLLSETKEPETLLQKELSKLGRRLGGICRPDCFRGGRNLAGTAWNARQPFCHESTDLRCSPGGCGHPGGSRSSGHGGARIGGTEDGTPRSSRPASACR